MSNEHSMRRVTAIRNGTVIDHIPQGHALTVLDMLGIDDKTSVPVSLVMNVPSKKMGSKDIIKVEDRELTQAELDRLALVAPDAHVAIIRAYTVAEKMTINLGDEIVNVVQCTYSNCITKSARATTSSIKGSLKGSARNSLPLLWKAKIWMNWSTMSSD